MGWFNRKIKLDSPTQMKVPKLNELQEVTCSACGLSGEIEI